MIAALGELGTALEENTHDELLLRARVEALQQALRDGMPLREALRAEPEPGTLQLVSRVHARISERSGVLRRAAVSALRQEGASIPAIAQLFGVTHQRVSNLLRRRAS